MKLIFVRHGEPDYQTDSLTPNGIEEARLLAQRVKEWHVTQFYVSPMGRAQETAKYSLELLGREAICLSFLREFSYPVYDEVAQKRKVPWDFVPSYWTNFDGNYRLEDGFLDFPCINENPDILENYPKVIGGIDELLASYGYVRQDRYYRNINAQKRYLKSTVSSDNHVQNNGKYQGDNKEPTLVFFCHLGVIDVILSHLLNIPFEALTHGFFLPTTSVTVVSTEERWDNEASFRVQVMGDCLHLQRAGHPISPAGSFADIFNG